jgi:hypothetical protein
VADANLKEGCCYVFCDVDIKSRRIYSVWTKETGDENIQVFNGL